MKLKAPSIEIPLDDPFKNDLLAREDSAKALTEVVSSSEDPLVICINAPWGEGKSTFIAMWRQMLNNSGLKTLYFNAWENDFSDDAFISLIGELELGIEELLKGSEGVEDIREHLKKAKKFGGALVKKSIPTAIKIATAGLVDLDDLTEEALSQYAEKIAENQIKQYEDSKKSVLGFKKQLEEIAIKIYSTEHEQKQFPLIILIDELDRCRPPYAIKVLEAVKHFYSVKNIVFVLALDQVQLGHSVRSMYGKEMDVSGYLKRFIDIDYSLPIPSKGAFCKAQFERFGLIEFFKNRRVREAPYERGNLQEAFSELFQVLELSLREQERCFTMLSLAIRSTPENNLLFPILLVTLIVIKIKNYDLYRRFVTNQATPEEVLNYIKSAPQGDGFLYGNFGAGLEAHLISCRDGLHNASHLLAPYVSISTSTHSTENERQRAQRVINLLQTYEFQNTYGSLNYLVAKIDMIANFRR